MWRQEKQKNKGGHSDKGGDKQNNNTIPNNQGVHGDGGREGPAGMDSNSERAGMCDDAAARAAYVGVEDAPPTAPLGVVELYSRALVAAKALVCVCCGLVGVCGVCGGVLHICVGEQQYVVCVVCVVVS